MPPDILDLYVNSFDNAKTGWTRYGTSPYLDAQDEPTNYIEDNVKKAEIGDFGFADSGKTTETINSVYLYIYHKTNDKYGITVFLWDGSAWNELTTWEYNTGGVWEWKSADVSAILDSWSKIDGAKIYIKSPNTAVYRYVDCAYLKVDYTPGGVLHERDISESFGVGDAVARVVTFSRGINESIGVGDSLERIGSYGRDLAESLGVGDTVTRSLSTMRSVSESLSLGDAVEGEIVEEKKRRGWPWHYRRG